MYKEEAKLRLIESIEKEIKNNNCDNAIKSCDNILKNDDIEKEIDYSAKIKILKAKAYIKKGEYIGAKKICIEELNNNGINDEIKAELYMKLGDLYTKEKDYDNARDSYNKGLKLNSRYKEIIRSKLNNDIYGRH